MRGLLAAVSIVLAVSGCATQAPPAPELDHDFIMGAQRYKVTREHGSSRLMLWREEGISWRLVACPSS